MIIAFYSGAGGNRYYQMLQGVREFAPATTYDHLLRTQNTAYRYPENNSTLANMPLILTHCMNVPLLKLLWPEHEVHVILCDRHAGLRREWVLAGQHRENNMPDPEENALGTIGFHDRYYQQYPVDTTGADVVINIDTDTSEFAVMMRDELARCASDIFDQAAAKFRPALLRDIPGDKVVQGFKSKFLDDAEKMHWRLDQVGPGMCLAKWKQVSLHLQTGLNNSCYHPPLHHIPVEAIQRNPSALHNTPWKKEQRREMLNGGKPAECSYCWNMEAEGKLSDRHFRSGESWAAKDFGKIISSEYSDDIIPSYVEVNFNNVCNLMCSYCSPQFSSSWQQEVDRLGGYPTARVHNDPGHFSGDRRVLPSREHNPYVEAFWEWWPTLYPELEHFRMTGGEPLLDKNTYRVFDYVLENPKSNLHLNVTSNFSVDEKSWRKYLDYVKRLCQEGNLEHYMQYVSLDGWGSQAEYIRSGMNFDLVWDRVNQFLTEVPSYNSLTFIVTMNNLSVPSLENLFTGILGLRKTYSQTYQRVWFDTPVLREPAWQSLQILPEPYAHRLEHLRTWMIRQIETPEDPFHGFKDYEIARLDRDIAWMRAGQAQDHSAAKADFYRFFSEHDRRRGTDFLKTFPEMRAWWAECEYHARNT
jgi:organic radical activating enzyme